MQIAVAKISEILTAEFVGSDQNIVIENISIDSRSLQNNSETLFFAIVGLHHDGHQYIDDLIQKGVRYFVVSKPIQNSKANFWVVENTLTVFQDFAKFYRSLFHFPVIGITGSNGKTIVKEWLNFLLSPDYNIVRSPKSYNSQVGVPLSVFAINEQHNFGIFEVGISTINEMQNLQKIVLPTIGILTNIGSAHDEGFRNTTEKINQKLFLFKESDVLIYQKNHLVDDCIQQNIEKNQWFNQLFCWSFEVSNSASPLPYQKLIVIKKNVFAHHTILQFEYQNQSYKIEIPFTDDASIENSINSMMVLLYLGYNTSVIEDRMKVLYPIEMRLMVKNGIQNSILIDDSYSADYQSLKIALDFLEHQKKSNQKTVILSDIYQSGLPENVLYQNIAQLFNENKINTIHIIGTQINQYKNLFANCFTYKNTVDFIEQIADLDFQNQTILIKGARSFEFEKIVASLEAKNHETVFEINLNAIVHNLNFYKQKLHKNVKTMVMVKAFGYGNGGAEIARLLEFNKVDYLGVAFADEGIALKNAGIRLPIMVLNPESTSFNAIIQHQLEPEIYSLKGLKSFLTIARQKDIQNYPIHIKIDSGMHRLGFEINDIEELITILRNTNLVSIKSILSHLATSDDTKHFDFVNQQILCFQNLSDKIINALAINPIRHILNTSGISNFLNAQFDMVRLGIGLYGITNESHEQHFLENVGTLKSVISQIRTIAEGESVGYGRRFVAEKPTKVATIPIGYADGISRHWGNGKGFVNINNGRAKILGSICMDMLMVDVTDIVCNEGDEVIIFGNSPTVIEMAQALETIPYEILTSISQRVKRVFYR